MQRRSPFVVIVAALVGLGGACTNDDAGGSASRTTQRSVATNPDGTTSSVEPEALADVTLTLTKVAELEQPVALAVRSGDDALYFVEKPGSIMALRDGQIDGTPTLDITGLVKNAGEQGFLGAAFSPDGTHLYVNYTDLGGDSRIAEYTMRGDRADASTRRELLFLDDPFPNHNGGNLVFGPDGMLWIGMGDSGSGGDPNDNAQSLDTLFGKMLRIDPEASGGRPYSIPPDNPFVNDDSARPEIWAYGLRNPWRYSFDRSTEDLWIGDVGQNAWEEIDFVAAGSKGGENFGWARLEGSHEFKGAAPPDAVGPIHEYRNSEDGCSVTGGYVYRGTQMPGLTGAYLFSDYCSSTVMGLRQSNGERTELEDLGLELPTIASFGEDADGELYVISLEGEIARIDPA
jgi:glucose/arabinose dehydrogenase